MKILFANNLHRGRGGSDTVFESTVRLVRGSGAAVRIFAKDSRDLPQNLPGRVQAFMDGIYARQAVRQFRDVLADFQPDLVHVFELYPLISPWILPVCTRARIPVVMMCCDYRLSCPVATRFRAGQVCDDCRGGHEHWALLHNCRGSIPESLAFAVRSALARCAGLHRRHVNHFVVPSEVMRQWLTADVGIPPDRVTLIHCAVHLPDCPVDDPSRGQYVAFAGRLVPEKGVEILLAAARQARLPLRMAGQARHHPVVGPRDDVQFVVTRSRAELAAFYRGARVVAMPSLFLETFGLVAAEAMSHGIPVVASRIGALESTVQDGRTGLLVEPGSVDALAGALRAVWDDPALCRRLGAAGRRRAAGSFQESVWLEQHLRLYRTVGGLLDSGRHAHAAAGADTGLVSEM